LGEVQGVRDDSRGSKRHKNVEPVSLELKSNLAVVPVRLPLGPLVMVVSGGVVSVPPPLPLAGKVATSKMAFRPVPVLPAVTLIVLSPAGRLTTKV
jgi:hypothetical protein